MRPTRNFTRPPTSASCERGKVSTNRRTSATVTNLDEAWLESSRPAQVTVVPQLEREQRPQLLAVVPPAFQVVADQCAHDRRIEKTLARDPVGREDREHLLLERAAEPVRDRDPKALLWPVEDRIRKDAAQSALEQEIRAEAAQPQ